MIEILPIRVLEDGDAPIFGSLNVSLAKLHRLGFPVSAGVVVTAPNLKLKTTLEHYDFGSKEVFEQSLTLVRKEINSIPVPEILSKELGKHKRFLLLGKVYRFTKDVWIALLHTWIDEIKTRLWRNGFYPGITESLTSQTVIFVKNIKEQGSAYFDPVQDDTVINNSDKLHPNDLKKLDEIVKDANKKMLIPYEYEWIFDEGIKLVGIKQYTPDIFASEPYMSDEFHLGAGSTIPPGVLEEKKKSTVKVFLDLSTGLVVERDVDGIYIASEKIFDLNKPQDSFEDLVFKVVEASLTFPNSPILFKLADKSEGMGKLRGALRLLHQQTLLDPMLEALDFVRHKKGLNNIHIVIPFVRSRDEFLQLKRELAVKKLGRKASLKLWLELAVPENIINLEDYLISGLDGVILNLDEMLSFVNGFDHKEGELLFYKNNLEGMLKFLEDGIKLLNKSKIPFIVLGSLALDPKVLDFLVEKGVWGIILERFEAPAAVNLLHLAERRMILRKTQ